jgi:hypothetical protein
MKLPLEGRWIVLIVVCGVGLTAMIVALARVVKVPSRTAPPTLSTRPVSITAVANTPADASMREMGELLDPTPLFRPTRYNTSQPEIPAASRREPGSITSFKAFAPRYAFAEDGFEIAFADPTRIPTRPVETLAFGRLDDAFPVFGQRDREGGVPAERSAFLEVVGTHSGQTVLFMPLELTGVPAAFGGEWAPLELVALIDTAGLVGAPALVKSSGVELVDGFIRSFLAKSFHLGQRLPAGFYVLRVGP